MASVYQIRDWLLERFGPEVILDLERERSIPPAFVIPAERLREVCRFLRDDPRLYFDQLMCLSGVDYGPERDMVAVVYHLHSIPHDHQIALKVFISRSQNLEPVTNKLEYTQIGPDGEPTPNAEPPESAVADSLEARTSYETEYLPAVDTVSDIWRTAEWHEREAYDLVGIAFRGHPDLRRILTCDDWPGHPLRKDYRWPEYYHGIRVAY
ncbi:MAG: NADH-quinone oxidoreductase subunit C [Bacteroidetes bacterium]|nr:NADH-quinone oxidoreductase subunit C [Rhodothermia bacterium]MCS7155518.1 NADH-quinone oxidoreductase subunit C [Bacteroidota bacterium]MCX7907389.1 NADH-quinone oxidoreductase subunit C [Bacteroidota bacterium]MDW8138383.1 NADH-quinone oxidoreductase subunit C [Bacteroidota bacterium]MDW8284680.1 NADH-quinone oxidoreductase subunit C [Bacteroidota bacterium]